MRAPLLSFTVLSVALLGTSTFAWQATAPERPAEPVSEQASGGQVRGPVAAGATLVFYDVRDLVADEPGDPRAGLAEREPSRFAQLFDPETGLGATPSGVAGLAHLIETYMEASLGESPAQVMAAEGGQLVVAGVQAQQDWVAEFLRLQRAESRWFMVVTRILAVPHGSLDDQFEGAEQGALVNSTLGQERLVELALEHGGWLASSPLILVKPRQRGSVAVTNRRSYVVDWDVHRVEPDQQVVLDPQIETIDEGTAVETRAVTLPGERLGLELVVTVAEIEEPVVMEPVEVHPGATQEIALVSQRVATASTSLVLSHGHVGLLVPGGSGDQDIVVSVLVDWVAPTGSPPADGSAEPVQLDERRGR